MANYLYNGIELPDINTVWTDKETYPYAFLGSDGVRTTLVITSMPAKVVPLYEGVVVPGTLYWHVIGLVKFFVLSIGSWGDAVDSAEFDDYVDVGIAGIVGGYEWSNHDILNADGSVYLAASDPVPVGGEPETSLTDYVIMPGADYKAACDAIRNKTGKTDLIKSGDMATEIAGISNGSSTDEASFNIHYGTEAPEDTTKLWVETDVIPDSVTLAPNLPVKCVSTNLGTQGNFGYDRANRRALAAVGSTIYSFGGWYVYRSALGGSASTVYLNTIKTFNTETEEITTLSVSLPVAAAGIAAVAYGTKIYLFGGYTGTERFSSIYEFDTETEEITTLSVSLPVAASGIAAVAYGTKIYLFGGYIGTEMSSSIYEFDTETEEITTIEDALPAKVFDCSAFIMDGYAYLFFDDWSQGISIQHRKKVSALTNKNTLWDNISTKNIAVWGYDFAVNIGKRIFFFGSTYDHDDVYMYDLDTEILSDLGYYHAGLGEGLSSIPIVVNEKIYLFMHNQAINSYEPAHVYSATYELEQSCALIRVSNYAENQFSLISGGNSIYACIYGVYIGDENRKPKKVNAYLHNGTAWELI